MSYLIRGEFLSFYLWIYEKIGINSTLNSYSIYTRMSQQNHMKVHFEWDNALFSASSSVNILYEMENGTASHGKCVYRFIQSYQPTILFIWESACRSLSEMQHDLLYLHLSCMPLCSLYFSFSLWLIAVRQSAAGQWNHHASCF